MWLLIFLFVLPLHAQEAPKVTIDQGVIIGSRALDGDYMTFYGIHYGGSTAGANRFKPPTEPPVYPGDYHAINSEVICAQPSSRGIIGTEDCLVLDVFTKDVASPKPVFVWIEGEEYETTNNVLYNFKHLVQEGIVVVSIKYRLSIFGFLCLGVPEAPGNAGLKDVIKGLEWIKKNIAPFGGDPNNIMLAGHGSGAAMVDLITLSPMSKDLIHKAFAVSGSSLAPWAVAYDPKGYAQMVGDKLGYTKKSPAELANLLSTTDITVLSGILKDFDFYNNTPLFAPCVENVKLNGTFLYDAPINILKSGNYTDVPYVAGFTDREGTMRAEQVVSRNWLQQMNENFANFLPVDLKFENNSVKSNVSQTVKNFYFAEQAVSMETIEDFLDCEGDILVLVPVIRGAKERGLTSKSDVRLFEFAFRGSAKSDDWIYPQIPVTGVRHGGFLNYLFNSNVDIGGSSAVTSIKQRVISFARTGSPAPVNMTEWKPVMKPLMNVLYLSGGEVAPNVTIYKEEALGNRNVERTDFWDKIHEKRYLPPRTVSSAGNLVSFGLVILFTQMIVKVF